MNLLCEGTWTHQLGVSTVVQYEVLRLQVSVYDAFGVQVGEGFHHTAGVEAGGGVLERAPETQGAVCDASQTVLISDPDVLTSCDVVS